MNLNLLDRLRADTDVQPATVGTAGARFAGKFVRAPLDWLQAAGRLRGKSLHVANALWFLSGVEASSTVRLSTKLCAQFGADRFAMYRALDALEEAHMVTVERVRGRCPVVAMLPTPSPQVPARPNARGGRLPTEATCGVARGVGARSMGAKGSDRATIRGPHRPDDRRDDAARRDQNDQVDAS